MEAYEAYDEVRGYSCLFVQDVQEKEYVFDIVENEGRSLQKWDKAVKPRIETLSPNLVSFEHHIRETSRVVQGVEEVGGSLSAAGLPPDTAPPVVSMRLFLFSLDRHGKTVFCHRCEWESEGCS